MNAASTLDPGQIAALIKKITGHRGWPKSSAPGGYGNIDRDGYRYILSKKFGYRKAEQRLVWEHFNGPIPDGMDVHHRDENKLNNSPDNLELMFRSEHVSMHRREKSGGYETRDGIEYKPCRECKEVIPLTAFYRKPSGKANNDSRHCWCKPCYNKKVVERKQRRLVSV